MLLRIPGILDPDQLARFQSQLAQAEWIDGRVTAGAGSRKVKSNEQLREVSPLRQELSQEILDTLSRNMVFRTSTLPQRILPPRFNRYRDGGEYGFHVDSSIMNYTDPADGAQKAIRSDISCTLFLSDPDSYDGGELVISDTYGMHQVKLPAGDMIVYPSSSLHRVTPVTRGARVSAFFWVQSKVRDPEHRQLLVQLDNATQALAADGAAADKLLPLHGIYHNLLRQWAEV
jgi:PKHD-type hydroxylase